MNYLLKNKKILTKKDVFNKVFKRAFKKAIKRYK